MRGSGFHDRYGSLFNGVFVSTFVTTYLAYPLILGGGERSGVGEEDYLTVYFFGLFIGLFVVAFPLFFKGLIIGGLVFAFVALICDRIVPGFLTFVLASASSAFMAGYLGLLINIDVYPPQVRLERDIAPLAIAVGVGAAVIATLFSAAIWAVRGANEMQERR